MTPPIRKLEPSVGRWTKGHRLDEADDDGQLWVDGVQFTSVRLLGLRLRRSTFAGARGKEGDDGRPCIELDSPDRLSIPLPLSATATLQFASFVVCRRRRPRFNGILRTGWLAAWPPAPPDPHARVRPCPLSGTLELPGPGIADTQNASARPRRVEARASRTMRKASQHYGLG